MNNMYGARDTKKYYFTLPNQIFDLGLHPTAISIYSYLLRIEDRRTYQCITSYSTISEKLGISTNTVSKYVAQLEEQGLIRTEHTEIIRRDGMKRNGCLRYHILPIRHAMELYHRRQMRQLELDAEEQRILDKIKS